MPEEDLISCLCITHRRVPLLKRAVQCFLKQTWAQRELIVLHEDGDLATAKFLAGNPHPLIRPLVVPAVPRIPLGTKRQIAMEAANGKYMATWDDDDWSSPIRLESQINVLRRSGFSACTLERWLVYDRVLGNAWLSQARSWEASIVAVRADMPRYEPVAKAEDLISITRMLAAKQVVGLREPQLYVYTCHGGNVSGRVHFKRNIFAHSLRLPDAFARRVGELLSSDTATPISSAELQAAVTQAGGRVMIETAPGAAFEPST